MNYVNAATGKLLLIILIYVTFLIYFEKVSARDSISPTSQNLAALNKCIKHTELALAYAKQGTAKLSAINAKRALKSIEKINNRERVSKLKLVSNEIESAKAHVEMGHTKKAVEQFEQALAKVDGMADGIVCCPKK